jgi:hypothetical protein
MSSTSRIRATNDVLPVHIMDISKSSEKERISMLLDPITAV